MQSETVLEKTHKSTTIATVYTVGPHTVGAHKSTTIATVYTVGAHKSTTIATVHSDHTVGAHKSTTIATVYTVGAHHVNNYRVALSFKCFFIHSQNRYSLRY